MCLRVAGATIFFRSPHCAGEYRRAFAALQPELTPLSYIEPPTANFTYFLPPDPLANGLKTGTLADWPRVPEDASTVHERTFDWYDSFKPQNQFHCWLVEQITITSMRIEHEGRIERRLRDRAVFRSRQFWDDDRQLDAINLGEKLAKAPAKVVNQLRRTPQGCDFLIDRWERLERIATGQAWNEAQCSLVFNMLGIHADEREGCGDEVTKKPLEVTGRELLALRKRKAEVAGLDALDRAMTEADYVDEPSDEVRRVRRHTGELQRWMKWCLERIDKKSPHQHTSTRSHNHFQIDDKPAEAPPVAAESQAAPPPAETPNLVIVGEAQEATEAPSPSQVFPVSLSDRHPEGSKKSEDRPKAKRPRLDRRRA